jgi:predicted nucleotidyltransferase
VEDFPKQRNIPPKDELGPKRFEIQSEGFVRERFKAVRKGLDLIKKDNPNILGLTIYGSMVKGRAHEASDIDGYLYIDAERLAREEEESALNERREPRQVTFNVGEVGKLATYPAEHLYDVFKPLIIARFTESGHLKEEQVQDINVRPISAEIINEHIESMVHKLTESRETGTEAQIEPSQNLFGLFHLAIGHELDTFRTQVIEKLEALGGDGELIWRAIINESEKLEQYMYTDTRINYPKTLASARKKYISEY